MPELLAGRYRVIKKLAAGGMGVVYVAEDERLGRRVAVKVLNEGLAGDLRFVERFRREARSAAALSHPNIATVFDYGESEGSSFIVMELVTGKDLSRVLREEGPVPFERVSAIATQTAHAIGHAHASDLVHRDIKPGNILITDGDKVKVTDFGIAQAAGATSLTVTGSLLGSAQYLSPEQAAGKPATPRSDVYALGIVMYEMLTGSVPFTADSAVAVAMRHGTENVPSPTALRPDTPQHLDDVVKKATARDPLDRFPDGAAMGAALSGASTGGGTRVMPGVGEEAAETKPLLLIPSGRWNPEKIGRVVLLTALFLIILVTVAGALRLFRVRDDLQKDPGGTSSPISSPSEPEPSTAPSTEPTAEQPALVTVPEGLVGLAYEDAAGLLVEQDLVPARLDSPSEEEDIGLVIGIDHEEGSDIEAGTTITLTVGTGPEEDPGQGGEGPGESDDPGKSDGKGHGKDKDKDKDKK